MFPFARPYPDELISSAIIRGCRHFALPLAAVGRQLHGKKGWRPTFHGTGDIDRLGELFRRDPNELLWRHTTLPYASAFHDQAGDPLALDLLPASASSPSSRRTLLQSTVCGTLFRRFCRHCVDRDVRDRGESFWHRSHQLPGVMFCTEHETTLTITTISSNGPLRDLVLPQDLETKTTRRQPLHASWYAIAASSLKLLNRPPGASKARPGVFYRELACKRGWLPDESAVSQKRLTKALENFYGKRLLSNSGLPATSGTWPGLMMRPGSDMPFVTVKHVLLEEFLRNQDVQAPLEFAYRPSGPSARSSQLIDAECTAAAKRELKEIAREGVRVSVIDWLSRSGCWQTYRHAVNDGLPRLNALVANFKLSPLASRPQIQLPFAGIPSPTTLRSKSHAMMVNPQSSRSVAIVHPMQQGVTQAKAHGTRLDLIRTGSLLSSKEMALRLGCHWTEMKRLVAAGDIFCIRYASRDFYPTFWCDSGLKREELESIGAILLALDGALQYRFFTAISPDLGSTPLRALADGLFHRVLEAAKGYVGKSHS